MTGAQLKILALTAMTLDHVGAVLLPQVRLLRMVGRLAMPIYCFLLGDGLRHARSLPRYLGRLLALALLSAGIIRRRWFTWVMVIATLLICYSRIYLAKHFPMDIVWGAALGAVLGWAGCRLYRIIGRRLPERK